MKNRLEQTYKLLKENGVLFITISDEGAHYLKVLADEIFDMENFIADITWEARKSISSDGLMSMNSNHILVYAKDKNSINKNDFILRFLIYAIIANLVSGIVNAFNFLNASLYVFYAYICPLTVNVIAYAVFVHTYVLKRTKGKKDATFLAYMSPFVIWKTLVYLSNVILYVTSSETNAVLQEWGFVFTTDPNEETAIIIGAALLGALLVYFAVTYIVLRYAKKPTDGGEPPKDQEKVKKEE